MPAIRHHHERFDGARLSGRAERGGDPARRADHPRRGRARLDADDARSTAPRGRPMEALDELQSRRRHAVLPALRRGARSGSCRRRLRGRERESSRPSCSPCRSDARLLARACGFSNLLYHLCMPRNAGSRSPCRRIDPARSRRVPGRDPQALLGRADPRASCSACAERLGRSPTMREFAADPETTVHPQTVIEHFGSWNAAKRDGRARPAAVRDARRARPAAARARRGARPPADRARPRRAPRLDAVEVALLAHVRLAHERAPRGRASTSRWGRSGSSARSSRAPRSRGSSAGCRSSPTGREARGAGRDAAHRVAGLPDVRRATRARGRRSSTSSASGCSRMGVEVSRPRDGFRQPRSRRGGRRQVTPSWGARTAGSGGLLEARCRAGSGSPVCRRPSIERASIPSGSLALAKRHVQVAARRSRAPSSSRRRRRSLRPSPSQSGRPTPRAM